MRVSFSDDEIAAIRARRAAQLQGSQDSVGSAQAKAHQEERQRAAEDQRAQILKALLAPSARERCKINNHSRILVLI